MKRDKKLMRLNERTILNIVGVAVLVYTAFLLYGITTSSLAEAAIPNEFQEVSNIQLTRSFLNGVNPFSTYGAFGREEPGVLYAYGPVYSLLTAALAKVFPVDLILLHYIVSYISMLSAAFLGARIVKENTGTIAAPAAVFALLINCTWRYGYVNAVPDALGFFWMMLALFTETRKKFHFKELLEIIIIILALHTKIYMAYIAIPIFVYKLFCDRNAALRFFIYGIVMMSVISVAVTIWCPLCWTYYIYFLHGPFAGTSQASGSSGLDELKDVITFRNEVDPESGLGYEILQLRSLVGMFLFFFVTAAVGFFDRIRSGLKNTSAVEKLLLADLIISVPVMYVLGTNDGAWLSYYLQIQIPPLVMFAMIYSEDRCLNGSTTLRRVSWDLFVIVMLVFTLYRTDRRLPYYYMLPEQKEIWEEAYRTIDECAQKGEIYYSPILAFDAEKNGRYYYNNGYVGAVSEELYSEYLNTEWERRLFPYAGYVMRKHLDYKKKLEEKIGNGEYELVMVNEGADGTDRAVRVSCITEGPYKLLKELYMPVSRENFLVKFYVRDRDK